MVTKVELKKVLFEAYDGFADKRYKKIEKDAPFIIDDRRRGDCDSRGELFLWFCLMFAEVKEGDSVRVTLRGGVPQSDAVSRWIADHKGEENVKHSGASAVFEVTPGNLDDLLELADHFAAITKRRYDVAAYKYVVPRVRDSLLRLHKVLTSAWA